VTTGRTGVKRGREISCEANVEPTTHQRWTKGDFWGGGVLIKTFFSWGGAVLVKVGKGRKTHQLIGGGKKREEDKLR